MARETFVLDPVSKKLVPKDEYLATRGPAGVTIIRDIEPYRAAAADKTTGKRPVITGRRQHREFLQRNGYVELGNAQPVNRTPGNQACRGDIARDIKRALGE